MEKNTKNQPSGKQAGFEFHLTGRITDRDTKQGLPGLQVAAVDKDPNYDQPLGSAITSENGRYAITFSSSKIGKGEQGGPDIVITVFNEAGIELGKSPMDRSCWGVHPGLKVKKVVGRSDL